jgi:hypothetical protein
MKRLKALEPATAATFAAVLMVLSPVSTMAQDGVAALAGNWSGSGQLRLDDGRSERLSCRANYSAREGGASIGMSIRCASPSYRIELRSSMRVAGGRVSGTWEERAFNAGGSLSGRSSAGQLSLSFSGSLSGSMSVNYGGGGISNVLLSLSRGGA